MGSNPVGRTNKIKGFRRLKEIAFWSQFGSYNHPTITARILGAFVDLKTFVSETLSQIVEGVADAKARLEAGGTGARINPVIRDSENRPKPSEAGPVEFDLALTVSQQSAETSTAKGEAKGGIISVFQAKVGADLEAKSGAQSQEVSRVKFTVMLAQPVDVTLQRPIQIPIGRSVI